MSPSFSYYLHLAFVTHALAHPHIAAKLFTKNDYVPGIIVAYNIFAKEGFYTPG